MAVTTAPGVAPLRGLRFVRGSSRLILLRWAVLVIAGLPGWLAAHVQLGAGPARRPYFSAPVGPLSLDRLIVMLGRLGPAMAAAAGMALAVAIACHWLLVPGAVRWLDRVHRGDPPRRLYPFVVEMGTAQLWVMARITLVAAALAIAGLGLLGLAFSRLELIGERHTWDSATLLVLLPRLRIAMSILWLALVGAGAFWCRVVMAADGRRRVRSAGLLVLRAWLRTPISGPALFVVATLASQALGAAYVSAWRQSAPRSVVWLIGWPVGWLLLLLVSAAVWHWLINSALLGYSGPRMASLRASADRPWYLLRRILRRPRPGQR